jgi:triosephosphate isomerase
VKPLRKPLIAGNWKAHKTHLEAIALVQKIHYLLRPQDHDAVETALCPPFTALRSVQTVLESDNIPIRLGAQNCHWEDQGAFTGEVTTPMLAKLKCHYVIVGHSERRHIFGETDDVVNKKAKAVFKHDMIPIVCVGETLEERDGGRTDDVIEKQVLRSLAGLTADQLGSMVIAYEPVWAIGTGRNALPEDANAVVGSIRAHVGKLAGDSAAFDVRVLYGGSVKAGNVRSFMETEHIDGALVGGASLDAEEFALIVRYRGD